MDKTFYLTSGWYQVVNTSKIIGDTQGVQARLTLYDSGDVIVVYLFLLLVSIDAKGNKSLVQALEPMEFQMNDWKKTLSGNNIKNIGFENFGILTLDNIVQN